MIVLLITTMIIILNLVFLSKIFGNFFSLVLYLIFFVFFESFNPLVDIQIYDNDIVPIYLSDSVESCSDDCSLNDHCLSFTFYDNECALKSRISIDFFQKSFIGSLLGVLQPGYFLFKLSYF